MQYGDLPSVKPSQLKAILELLDHMDNPPALMVFGPPGVGKTRIIKDFADEKNYELRVKFLSRMDPSDWSGIPRLVKYNECRFTQFFPIDLFRPPAEGKRKIVLFFDELNTASVYVLNAALDVILEKRSDHSGAELPPDTIIVAAGNLGAEDGTYVEELSMAVKTRLIQVRLETDLNDWLNWAKSEKAKIHPVVIDFVRQRGANALLDLNAMKRREQQVPTPRGWERVSHLLTTWEKNSYGNRESDLVLKSLIQGVVGMEIGKEFYYYYKNLDKMVIGLARKLSDFANKIKNLSASERVVQESVKLAAQLLQEASRTFGGQKNNRHAREVEDVMKKWLEALDSWRNSAGNKVQSFEHQIIKPAVEKLSDNELKALYDWVIKAKTKGGGRNKPHSILKTLEELERHLKPKISR